MIPQTPRFIVRLRHWWHGCAYFNRRWPHWRKDETRGAKYPLCVICNRPGYWMWGYKHFLPDLTAQLVQGTRPDATDEYWSQHDRYRRWL